MRNVLSTASPGGAHSVKSRNGRRLGLVLATLLGVVAVGGIDAAYAEREPGGLPESAPKDHRKYKPAMDYDQDGCYPTPAIGPSGKLNPGKQMGGDVNGECRDEVDLDDANIYSRSKCNNGWCAYMYAFYFEKDQVSLGPGSAGHTHDWEHVVVWVKNDKPMWVSVSQHGGYSKRRRDQVRWKGTHAKVVYHKDGGSTHAFRFATGGDEPPENHKGKWHLPKVISWGNFPPGFRKKMASQDWGEALLELRNKDEDNKVLFEKKLKLAKPNEVRFNP